MTCSYETREVTGASDWLAHNPEVAGSNPVPATKGNGPRVEISGGRFRGLSGPVSGMVGEPTPPKAPAPRSAPRWHRHRGGRTAGQRNESRSRAVLVRTVGPAVGAAPMSR